MKRIILLILLSLLVLFVSCKKAEAKKDGINEVATIEQEKLVEVADEKTELEPVEVQVGSVSEQVVGIINNTRVRLRSEPNLQSETLEYLNTGDSLIILDKSVEQQKIDNMEDYWYKVQVGKQPEGWVYGAFVDIGKVDFLAMALKYNFNNLIDYSTGMNAFRPEDYENTYDNTKVKKITMLLEYYGAAVTETYSYIDGQIISLRYTGLLGSKTYEYDTEGRLSKMIWEGDARDTVYTYTYPEVQNENEISRFTFRDDSHISTETVRLIKDGYEITVDELDLGHKTYQFKYNDSVLQQIVTIDSYDTEVAWRDFSYEEGVVKKITYAESEKDNIVSTHTMSYENFQLKELVYDRFFNNTTDYKVLHHFSDYDEYGNWQTREDYEREVVYKNYREIEYY